MDRKTTVGFALLAAFLVGLSPGLALSEPPASPPAAQPAAQPGAVRPNIVIIYADDLGYGDLGCYGSTRNQTPNLDRLARQGMRFTDFYSAATVCTPSRAALLTGRYPVRSGLTYVLFPSSRTGIDDAEVTLAEALKEHGYATACIGKWHLGHLPQFLPTRHGFDSYFGLPYSNDMRPTPLLRNERIVEETAYQPTLTERYTNEAVRYIGEHRQKPFFLYLAHTMPHVPLAVSKDFKVGSNDHLYAAVIRELDASVGRIVDALREARVDRQTLVIFSSDNGPWLVKKDQAGTAGNLRAGKTTLYEGGVRVPMIAYWPGRVPAGRTCREPAIMLDLFPTCLALAGVQAPQVLDGRDITPLLTNTGTLGERDFYFYQGDQLHALRSGKWKLHGRYKLPNGTEHSPELFDLVAEPSEKNDLAPQRTDLVTRLTKRMETFDREVKKNAPMPKR